MSETKGCCEWFTSLFRNPNKNSSNSDNKEINENSEVIAPANNEVLNQQNYFETIIEHQNQQIEQERIPQKLETCYPEIDTIFNENEIVFSNFRENSKGIYYNCPICLRYFNHILVLQCCSNYLCYFCIQSFIETSKKYSTNVKCLICNSSQIMKLVDVDPKDELRYYSDSVNEGLRKTLMNHTKIFEKIVISSIKKSEIRKNKDDYKITLKSSRNYELPIRNEIAKEIKDINLRISNSFKEIRKDIKIQETENFEVILRTLSKKEYGSVKIKGTEGSEIMKSGEFYFEPDNEIDYPVVENEERKISESIVYLQEETSERNKKDEEEVKNAYNYNEINLSVFESFKNQDCGNKFENENYVNKIQNEEILQNHQNMISNQFNEINEAQNSRESKENNNENIFVVYENNPFEKVQNDNNQIIQVESENIPVNLEDKREDNYKADFDNFRKIVISDIHYSKVLSGSNKYQSDNDNIKSKTIDIQEFRKIHSNNENKLNDSFGEIEITKQIQFNEDPF